MTKELKASIVNEVHWENGLTYSEYRELIQRLLAINKTTGDNHSENMLSYTKLNEQRMNKWEKIAQLTDELKTTVANINEKQNWLILTEGWCGDAAQNIPVINKIAELNSNIELRLLLRDENLDIMDEYLTDGGRSIPKLIILDEEFQELAQWGPRPQPVQEKLLRMKAGELTYEEFATELHTWYAKDRTLTLQTELNLLLTRLA
ncbi:thioredoxin family protein [Fulvivirga lutea]|uniref:Thioredoxin family protein n=1 Tax=Fulvivirga lutea TaxID=2810512 RepID=A0A975A0Y2_9BACT|nr:thioredoxin family protein [Fulvivirga lutea]QSE97716.1 thioredoxin family protein [Fulvivirga lutea]